MAGWKSSGKRVGEGQPLQWKKVEECLQLRPRTNKPQSWRLVVAGARFPAPSWQSLRQGLCVSKEETEAPRGSALCPEHFSFCPYPIASRPKPCPFHCLGPQFPHMSKKEFQAPCLCLHCVSF